MQEKIALISDVHANLEALKAVLMDIKNHNIKTIYSLGDVIGLGNHPRECLKLILENNIINTPKAYSTKCTIGFCHILQEYYLIHQNTVRINMATYFYQEFILLKYSIDFGENSTNVFP